MLFDDLLNIILKILIIIILFSNIPYDALVIKIIKRIIIQKEVDLRNKERKVSLL